MGVLCNAELRGHNARPDPQVFRARARRSPCVPPFLFAHPVFESLLLALCAAAVFGVVQYGSHVNGYVVDAASGEWRVARVARASSAQQAHISGQTGPDGTVLCLLLQLVREYKARVAALWLARRWRAASRPGRRRWSARGRSASRRPPYRKRSSRTCIEQVLLRTSAPRAPLQLQCSGA